MSWPSLSTSSIQVYNTLSSFLVPQTTLVSRALTNTSAEPETSEDPIIRAYDNVANMKYSKRWAWDSDRVSPVALVRLLDKTLNGIFGWTLGAGKNFFAKEKTEAEWRKLMDMIDEASCATSEPSAIGCLPVATGYKISNLTTCSFYEAEIYDIHFVANVTDDVAKKFQSYIQGFAKDCQVNCLTSCYNAPPGARNRTIGASNFTIDISGSGYRASEWRVIVIAPEDISVWLKWRLESLAARIIFGFEEQQRPNYSSTTTLVSVLIGLGMTVFAAGGIGLRMWCERLHGTSDEKGELLSVSLGDEEQTIDNTAHDDKPQYELDLQELPKPRNLPKKGDDIFIQVEDNLIEDDG